MHFEMRKEKTHRYGIKIRAHCDAYEKRRLGHLLFAHTYSMRARDRFVMRENFSGFHLVKSAVWVTVTRRIQRVMLWKYASMRWLLENFGEFEAIKSTSRSRI